MEEEKIVVEESTNEQEGPGKIYDFADIHFNCSVCGNDIKWGEGFRGISFTVPAAEKAEVKLQCTKCGATLKLYFKESSEEVKALRREELENGVSQENTEVESGQGSVDDTERPIEVNEEAATALTNVDEAGQSVDA